MHVFQRRMMKPCRGNDDRKEERRERTRKCLWHLPRTMFLLVSAPVEDMRRNWLKRPRLHKGTAQKKTSCFRYRGDAKNIKRSCRMGQRHQWQSVRKSLNWQRYYSPLWRLLARRMNAWCARWSRRRTRPDARCRGGRREGGGKGCTVCGRKEEKNT